MKTSYKELLRKIISLNDTPHKIALSFSVGVFISISPFFGFHTMLSIVLSIIFKLNKVATISGSWLNNPWTTLPVYYTDYKIGAFLLADSNQFNLKPFTIEHYWHNGRYAFLDIFVGSIIFGIFMSIVSYFVIRYLVEKYRRRKNVSN